MIIGIIGREGVFNNRDVVIAYKGICHTLFNYGFFPICLIPSDFSKLKEMIGMCDGIVLQGGEELTDNDLLIARYLYENDIPTLGICLGMQIMGKAFNGVIIKNVNHDLNLEYAHYVKLNKDSFLFEIIGKEYIFVNSFHHDAVLITDLDMTSYYGDVLESLEDRSKRFFLGVQWHPEFLNDENSDKIFMAFKGALEKK